MKVMLCVLSSLWILPLCVQMGNSIALFAFTQSGKEFLIVWAKAVKSPVLVNAQNLPSLPFEKQPPPLK